MISHAFPAEETKVFWTVYPVLPDAVRRVSRAHHSVERRLVFQNTLSTNHSYVLLSSGRRYTNDCRRFPANSASKVNCSCGLKQPSLLIVFSRKDSESARRSFWITPKSDKLVFHAVKAKILRWSYNFGHYCTNARRELKRIVFSQVSLSAQRPYSSRLCKL